jgi:CRISPR-associated protein (Cas_Cmr5)
MKGVRRVDTDLAARAARVIDALERASGGTLPAEVITRLKGLPAMLQSSGVPATLVFYAARANRDGGPVSVAYAEVGRELCALLAESLGIAAEDAEVWPLLARLETLDLDRTVLAHAQLAAFAGWLRRLAAAWQPPAGQMPGAGR